jgi:hypothetical protein
MDLGAQAATRAADGLIARRLPGPRCVLMGAHDRAVEDQILEVRVIRDGGEEALPNALLAPAAEPAKDAVRITKTVWQIPPWRTGAGDPQHGFDEQAVVSP